MCSKIIWLDVFFIVVAQIPKMFGFQMLGGPVCCGGLFGFQMVRTIQNPY